MWKLYCLALLHCSFTSRPAGCGKLLWFGLASLLQQPSPDSSRLWETIAGPHYLRALLNKTVPLMMGHSDWEARMKEMKWLSLPAATIAGQALLLQSLLSSWGTFLYAVTDLTFMHGSRVFVWIVGFLTSVNGNCAVVLWGHYNGFQILWTIHRNTMDFSQSDMPGQGFWGKSLCFLRIAYIYAGLGKMPNEWHICCWNLSVDPSQISIPVIHRD